MERDAARDEFHQSFEGATDSLAQAIRMAASDSRFREAVLWQNRGAYRTAVTKVADRAGDGGSQRRQHEALVGRYLQRYSLKNDTIGFFGPVGWAQVVDEGPAASVRAGDDLLAERTVYWEAWAWEEVARMLESRAEVRRELVPQQLPASAIADDQELIKLCDGKRSIGEIAHHLGISEDELAQRLERLREEQAVDWSFYVPRNPHALESLLAQIQGIEASRVRDTCMALLEGARKGSPEGGVRGGRP